MDAAKVGVGEVKAERGPQVFPLARKALRQPRESPNLHSHGEVLALHNRRADAFGVGVSADWDCLRRNDFSGASIVI